jgi:hypothetical protein
LGVGDAEHPAGSGFDGFGDHGPLGPGGQGVVGEIVAVVVRSLEPPEDAIRLDLPAVGAQRSQRYRRRIAGPVGTPVEDSAGGLLQVEQGAHGSMVFGAFCY